MKDQYQHYLELLKGLRLMDDDSFQKHWMKKSSLWNISCARFLSATTSRFSAPRLRWNTKAQPSAPSNWTSGCGCRGPRTGHRGPAGRQGASVRRARFHSSVIDRTLLEKGEDFDALVDTYVIFITEHDKYGAGLPLYHVERTVTELRHTTFGDGAHIIYVNGAFRDLEHPVGRLMHDMNCTDPNKMLNPLLAKEVRYLKETEGGRSQMCRAFEEVARESARDAEYQKAVRTAKKMLALGQLNLETIAECTELSLDEVKALADKKPA